jgi:hypothetical protein
MLLFGEAGDEVAAETVEFGYGKDNGLGEGDGKSAEMKRSTAQPTQLIAEGVRGQRSISSCSKGDGRR